MFRIVGFSRPNVGIPTLAVWRDPGGRRPPAGVRAELLDLPRDFAKAAVFSTEAVGWHASCDALFRGDTMEALGNETAAFLEEQFAVGAEIEVELGTMIAAISDWTEDETELDDLLGGLVETRRIALSLG